MKNKKSIIVLLGILSTSSMSTANTRSPIQDNTQLSQPSHWNGGTAVLSGENIQLSNPYNMGYDSPLNLGYLDLQYTTGTPTITVTQNVSHTKIVGNNNQWVNVNINGGKGTKFI